VISLADEDTPRMSHQASNWGLCMDFNRGTSCPSFCDVEAVPSFEAELKAKPAAKPQVDAEDQADGEANKAFYGPTRTSLETSCGRSEEAGWVRSKSSCLSSESLNFHQLFKAGSGEWWLPRPSLDELRSAGSDSHLEEARLRPGWWGSSPQQLRGEKTTLREKGIFAWFRRLAADRRHRYDFHGFDLDLAYVTSRVIAMGFPSQGAGRCFRNPQSEVDRFLRWAHGDDFRIYNLCAESSHRNNGFPDETVSYPCPDHCPPDMAAMLSLCRDVESWLARTPSSVAVIHCKAGKGRSGTMACALLLYADALPSAQEALRWFARVRGGTRSGVTIPSQIRWVAMFENWLRGQVELCSDPMSEFSAARYRLRSIKVGPLHSDLCSWTRNVKAGGSGALLVHVGLGTRVGTRFRWVHWYTRELVSIDEDSVATLMLPDDGPVWAEHDGRLGVVLQKPGGCSRPGSLPLLSGPRLHVGAWWHHSFLKREPGCRELVLDLPKAFIDGLQKDASKHLLAPPSFRLTAEFEEQAE